MTTNLSDLYREADVFLAAELGEEPARDEVAQCLTIGEKSGDR